MLSRSHAPNYRRLRQSQDVLDVLENGQVISQSPLDPNQMQYSVKGSETQLWSGSSTEPQPMEEDYGNLSIRVTKRPPSLEIITDHY